MQRQGRVPLKAKRAAGWCEAAWKRVYPIALEQAAETGSRA